eukprot:scaffold308315_cov22-Tisochrysis_lutea.AAC.1
MACTWRKLSTACVHTHPHPDKGSMRTHGLKGFFLPAAWTRGERRGRACWGAQGRSAVGACTGGLEGEGDKYRGGRGP